MYAENSQPRGGQYLPLCQDLNLRRQSYRRSWPCRKVIGRQGVRGAQAHALTASESSRIGSLKSRAITATTTVAMSRTHLTMATPRSTFHSTAERSYHTSACSYCFGATSGRNKM